MAPSTPGLSVIILAAGDGSRMNAGVPKQFLEVGGESLLSRSISAFEGRADEIIVTIPLGADSDVVARPGVHLVQGGRTRTESVAVALSEVSHDRVLIHDAARPFVTSTVITDILGALETHHCAYPVMPVVNSIVVDKGGELAKTPKRSRFKEVQTPQGFRTKTLRRALELHGDEHAHLPELVRRLGKKVKHTEGSPWLFKLTYAPSLQMAQYYVDHVEPTVR
jgi:2-C-methyl-D-erythritol 4-phosphate cytidylyltransferase